MNPLLPARRAAGLLTSVVLGASFFLSPTPAEAWDVSSTHAALTDAAVLRSALHRTLMDASELERGIFSNLRVDPRLLADDERRLLLLAQRSVHADSGGAALGGPGACPPGDTPPPETKQFCVAGDLWELSVLGWLRFGLFAELTPSARAAHHFFDRDDLQARTWNDPELGAARFRRWQSSRNGASFASRFTRLPGRDDGPSVWSWLDDANDPLAPARLAHHLERASFATLSTERDHHLALALVCTGALLHVVQDASVPAHARGDATAFFSALSEVNRDRGLPLQEFVRRAYGRRDLPLPDASVWPAGDPIATDLTALLVGTKEREGLATLARARFLSGSLLPSPVALHDELTPEQAAAKLLADLPLDDQVRDGAELRPWPATRGYAVESDGDPLFAFSKNENVYEFYFDDHVYRHQATVLLPAALEASRSLLDLLYPTWPAATDDNSVQVPAHWTSVVLHTTIQRRTGERAIVARADLAPGMHPLPPAPSVGEGERVVFVLAGQSAAGMPVVTEYLVPLPEAPAPAAPVPGAAESRPLNEGSSGVTNADEQPISTTPEGSPAEATTPPTLAPPSPELRTDAPDSPAPASPDAAVSPTEDSSTAAPSAGPAKPKPATPKSGSSEPRGPKANASRPEVEQSGSPKSDVPKPKAGSPKPDATKPDAQKPAPPSSGPPSTADDKRKAGDEVAPPPVADPPPQRH